MDYYIIRLNVICLTGEIIDSGIKTPCYNFKSLNRWSSFARLISAIANFQSCLEKVNSQENYDKFLYAGFNVLLKDESRSIDETMQMVELYMKL